jgi:hypothetical protein
MCLGVFIFRVGKFFDSSFVVHGDFTCAGHAWGMFPCARCPACIETKIKREEALVLVLSSFLSPEQAASALEQWEAVLAERPELGECPQPDREA